MLLSGMARSVSCQRGGRSLRPAAPARRPLASCLGATVLVLRSPLLHKRCTVPSSGGRQREKPPVRSQDHNPNEVQRNRRQLPITTSPTRLWLKPATPKIPACRHLSTGHGSVTLGPPRQVALGGTSRRRVGEAKLVTVTTSATPPPVLSPHGSCGLSRRH